MHLRTCRFYSGLLGLRFVKKTVNFDDPTAYHLYYGDEAAIPGSILTFFEYPGAGRGSAGQGMIHRIAWRVADEQALDFWQERLRRDGVPLERFPGALRFRDPEGLELELAASRTRERAARPRLPPTSRSGTPSGGSTACARSRPTRGAAPGRWRTHSGSPKCPAPTAGDDTWRVAGERALVVYAYDPAPQARPVQGAGTVHHIAWAVPDDDQPAWRERVLGAGLHATPIIDRTYFRSVYFREPSGVLFEIATLGPGFAVDEPLEHLGESLQLPAQYEYLRPRLEQELTPLVDPRRRAAA